MAAPVSFIRLLCPNASIGEQRKELLERAGHWRHFLELWLAAGDDPTKPIGGGSNSAGWRG